MIRRIAMSVVGLVVLSGANAHAAGGNCISALYSAAGKYAGCEAKAAAKGTYDFFRCRKNYAATWTKLGTKYPDTSCAGARFVDNGLTITDNLTQLVWEKKTTAVDSGANLSDRHDVDNAYTLSIDDTAVDGTAFTDFLDNLNSTGFAGQHDWRLPTLYELHTIVSTDAAPCAAAPCIADPLFSPTQPGLYWSSSIYPDLGSPAWFVYFSNGYVSNDFKTNPFYVRAVRGGL